MLDPVDPSNQRFRDSWARQDFHPTRVLFTILLIQRGLVIPALDTADSSWEALPPNCVVQICGVELLKSLTGAEMRISIKTDPG